MEKIAQDERHPLQAWFLGTKAENGTLLSEVIEFILQDYMHWRRNYFPEDKTIVDRRTRRSHEPWIDNLSNELEKILNQLKADYPFYSPRYLAHMTSENALPGIIGYFAGMLYNPNNVTHEAAPITIDLEIEAGQMVAEMLGFDKSISWSHITSGGTIANLEALWAARQNQLNSFGFRAVCEKYKIDFEVRQPDGRMTNIREMDNRSLIGLKTQTQISMPDDFCAFVDRSTYDVIINDLLLEVKESDYSIARHGIVSVYNRLKIEPVILVSESTHYSIKKIANILGLGEAQVIHIPVDEKFRMNSVRLEETLESLSSRQVCMAVVGILGTTEEGAVDPIDEIVKIRERYEQKYNSSFWLHIDAAWGGYLRTMNKQTAPLLDEVKAAISCTNEADSITIDPHKMGYIPYPAGMINFRDKRTVLHAHQKAPYITQSNNVPNPFDAEQLTGALGAYIVEGSKPGAAAAATWLTHKTIPLNENGHGRIVMNSIREAHRFHELIQYAGVKMRADVDSTISLYTISTPDTNVVCYFFHVKESGNIKLQNQLNEKVYKSFSLNKSESHMPYRQDFFISHTHFLPSQYPYSSIRPLLVDLNITKKEYQENGLFILRSVIMNPWITSGMEQGTDYIQMFVNRLQEVGEKIYNQTV
jgi:glutamate/tyrosine decarboxylase-like PLP-dependent enzyme